MPQSRLTLPGFDWLDVVDPVGDELLELEKALNLPHSAVQDCLEPQHLPKFEDFENFRFLILRAYDHACTEDADSVRDLTRKLAVFISPKIIVTVHRKPMVFFSELMEKYKEKVKRGKPSGPDLLLLDIIAAVVHTYDRPVAESMDQLEVLEEAIFGGRSTKRLHLKNSYYLKRRASVFKRMLRTTVEPLNSLASSSREVAKTSKYRNVREHMDNIYFYADEVTDTLDSMLNLQVSLASQRTNEASHRINEIMRVLTIFSIFFLPINFIASIYGMNFEWMPELKMSFGYPMVLLLMLTVEIAIFLWIRRKGWLR